MALSDLPNTMLAAYNGHTFGPDTDTTDLRVTPVYDSAGRTVVYSVYAITLRETISPATVAFTPASEALTAATVEDTIARLSRPGGELRYRGRGFGDLDINVGPRTDVIWGPKPKVIGLKTHGGMAVELTWQVEVAIPNCDDAIFTFALMEFCFKLSFDKDRQGYTTRTYSGFLRVPQTRKAVGDRTLSDSADAYLERIYPPLVPGFRRTPGSWVLSEDKCRGDFSVTDEQMPPNAPPLGVIEAASNHTYQSSSLAHWTGTLSATYDLARGASASFAVEAFLALLKRRAEDAARMRIGRGLELGRVPAPLARNVGQPVTLIPVHASASEPNIYGRTQVALSVTYAAAGVGFTEVFANGGLWQPLGVGAGGKWDTWALSAGVADALGARGHARLVFKPNEDAIVDLCGRSPPRAPGGGGQVVLPPAPGGALGAAGAGGAYAALLAAFPAPKPASSWLSYRSFVTVHPDLGRVAGGTLPTAPLSAAPGARPAAWDVYGGVPTTEAKGGSPFPPLGPLLANDQRGGETFVQQRTRPKLFVTVHGQALRAGYEIPVPELVSLNGKRPIMVGTPYFAQGVVANEFFPIVRADWQFTYLFTEEGGIPAGPIPVPPNPFLA